MTKSQQPEGVIKTQIVEALRRMGVFVRTNTLSGRTWTSGMGPGSSDLVCCVAGKWVSLEVKTAKGVAQANQLAFAEELREAGGVYAIVRSPQEAIDVVMAVRRAA